VEQTNPSGINANASALRPSRMSVGLLQLLRYGLAVFSIGVAVGTLLLFEHLGWRPPTGMLMLTVIALNSWYGERGPALLALLLGFFRMAYFFMEPRYSIHVLHHKAQRDGHGARH
jgi:K+-sensing histidine kinase KdpD